MKKLFLITMGLSIAAVLSLGFLAGCEKDATEPVDLLPGNVNDPGFQLVNEIFNVENLQLNMVMLGLSMDLTDSIPIPGQPAGPFKMAQIDPDIGVITIGSYTYDEVNFWHIFTLAVTAGQTSETGTDSVFFEGIDSIRFEGAEGPMQYPHEELTTAMKFRWHFDADVVTSEGDSAAASTDASFDIHGEYMGDFTINGFSSDYLSADISDEGGSLSLDLSVNQTLTNLLIDSVVQEDLGCPAQGSAGAVATIDMVVAAPNQTGGIDSLVVHSGWTINYLFHPDRTVTVTYTDGVSLWEVTEDCSGDVPAKLVWARALKAIQD